jgi:hypothetical protein
LQRVCSGGIVRWEVTMSGNRGVALILSLLFLSFLTVLATALLATATIDVWIGDNYNTNTQALYLAEAGVEHARFIAGSRNKPNELLAASAGANSVLSTSTDLAGLLGSDDQPLLPSDPVLRIVGEPLRDGTGRVIGRYHVWLRNDNGDGPSSPADTNQTLTLLSVGTIGRVRRVVEETITKGKIPKFEAALTLNGPVGFFAPSQSNFFRIDGNDSGFLNESENAIGMIDSSVLDAGTMTADVANVEAEMVPNIKTVSGLEDLVARITLAAATVYKPALGATYTIENFGTTTDYKLAVINGDVNLGSGSGYGILVVRGMLNVTGNFNWHGVILVLGQGVMKWSAGANGAVHGAVMLARTRADDRSSENLLGSLLAARGPVSADFTAAGGSGVQLDTSAIAAANQSFPYIAIAVKER